MLKTFSIGGIHPPENKLSAGKKITEASIPTQVVVPLGQHIGKPAKAIVKKGDAVKVGTLIAESDGFISANIHASVSGTVQKIDEAIDASGYRKPAIFIDVEGDEWEEGIDKTDDLIEDTNLPAAEIIQKIAAAGIVGLGGAAFPTHIKLSPPPGKTAELLIINASECEPYLTSDHALMLEKGAEIMVGIQLLMKAIHVDKAVIGIENNKPDAIAHLQAIAQNYPGIDICPLKARYPQGGEKQLTEAIIKKQIKSGALPIEVGVVVQNVGTAFAVYEAVQKNKPLIERVVTLTGKGVENPANYKVRIGTPVNQLIEASGGLPEDTAKIVGGGPMMGKALTSADIPVVKGTSGVLILRKNDTERKKQQNCVRCARCVSVCPMGLSPYLLMNLSEKSIWDKAEKNSIMDCVECGSCVYTCPANRALLDFVRLGKSKVNAIMRSRTVAG